MQRRSLIIGAAVLGLPLQARAADEVMRIDRLIGKDGDIRAAAQDCVGSVVSVRGFMAPSLQSGAPVFVLRRDAEALCPFCDPTAVWPADILVVYPAGPYGIVPYNKPVVAVGRLELGPAHDAAFNLTSVLRLRQADLLVA